MKDRRLYSFVAFLFTFLSHLRRYYYDVGINKHEVRVKAVLLYANLNSQFTTIARNYTKIAHN